MRVPLAHRPARCWEREAEGGRGLGGSQQGVPGSPGWFCCRERLPTPTPLSLFPCVVASPNSSSASDCLPGAEPASTDAQQGCPPSTPGSLESGQPQPHSPGQPLPGTPWASAGPALPLASCSRPLHALGDTHPPPPALLGGPSVGPSVVSWAALTFAPPLPGEAHTLPQLSSVPALPFMPGSSTPPPWGRGAHGGLPLTSSGGLSRVSSTRGHGLGCARHHSPTSGIWKPDATLSGGSLWSLPTTPHP